MSVIPHGILLGLAVSAPVGPTNIEVTRRGFKEGWKSSLIFFLGAVSSFLFYMLIVVFGLSFLMQSEAVNVSLMALGVAVMLFLAYHAIGDYFRGTGFDLSGDVKSKSNYIPGFVLTISNPAILVMWTGILGADLAATNASLNIGLMLIFGILIGVFTFFLSLIGVVHWGRRYVTSDNFKYISLGAGVLLLYFALSFGYNLVVTLVG